MDQRVIRIELQNAFVFGYGFIEKAKLQIRIREAIFERIKLERRGIVINSWLETLDRLRWTTTL